MVAWDATALTLLVQSWSRLATCDAKTTKERAAVDDPGRRAVFVLAMLASSFGFFGSVLLLRLSQANTENTIWLLPALLSVALSWFVMHTEWTLRYAHLFYRGQASGGMMFPGTERPDDLDFAYYAFTIGMCFQVSDVQISSREIRRATLIHALISFVFNTTILALTVNIGTQLLNR